MNAKTSLGLVSFSALAAGIAQGSVVYSGPLNLQQNQPNRQPVDLNNDGISDFTFGYEGDQKPYVDGRTYVSDQIPLQSGIFSALAQSDKGLPTTPAGTMIDALYEQSFPAVPATSAAGRAYFYKDDSGNVVIGDWPNDSVTDAYIGMKLTSGGSSRYGWAHFIDNPTAGTPNLTLVDWAYESTPDLGIATAVVPEPTASVLGGLGIAALLALRQRRD